MNFLFNLNTNIISNINLYKLPKLYKKKLAYLVTYVIRNLKFSKIPPFFYVYLYFRFRFRPKVKNTLSVIHCHNDTFLIVSIQEQWWWFEYIVIQIVKKIWPYKICKTHHCALWLRYQQIHTTTNLLLLYPEWDCSEFSSIKEKFDSIWYLKESIRKLLSQNAHFCIFYWSHSSGK